jgi:hypothetical protein
MGRRDQLLPQGDELWTRADRVELWLIGAEPIESMVFDVRSLAPDNRIEARDGRQPRERSSSAPCRWAATRRVTLRRGADAVRRRGGATFRMATGSTCGRASAATRSGPARRRRPTARTTPRTASGGRTFRWRGDHLDGRGGIAERDVFAARFESCPLPSRVEAGSAFAVRSRCATPAATPGPPKAGPECAWPSLAHARRRAGDLGRERTELGAEVAPGARLEIEQLIAAPGAPGRYLLERPGLRARGVVLGARPAVCRGEVEVVAAPAPSS